MSLTETILWGFFLFAGLVILCFCGFVLKCLQVVLSFVWRHFLRPCKNLEKSYGTWAVVTGATDGIGKAYAFELARKGLNVYLISRTQSKLEATADEIKAKHGVECRTLAIDYSSFGAGDPQHAKVAAALEGVDVGVLINNVGMSYPYPQYFHELSDDEVDKLLHLNVNSTTYMTRLVLPGMVERKRGAVVNVSSTSGLAPTALLAQYSASKAYTDFLAQSLAYEYGPKGIFFQVQSPLWVTTKLAKIWRSSLVVPTPATYARAAVATIGHDQNSVAYWIHDIMASAVFALNQVVPSLLGSQILSMHLGVRKKALRKKERQAKEAAEGKKDA